MVCTAYGRANKNTGKVRPKVNTPRFKVIRCTTDELEYELNAIGEEWAPACFTFTQDVPSSHVVVVCVRPQVQSPMQIAIPAAAIRRN